MSAISQNRTVRCLIFNRASSCSASFFVAKKYRLRLPLTLGPSMTYFAVANNDIRRFAKLEWPKSERCRSQYLPPIVARIVVEPIVIALIVVAIVDLVLPIPRN